MTGVIVTLKGLVVLAAIFLGVRMGGIGLGLWGVLGTGGIDLHLRDGPRFTPVDAFFIIIAVITASAAMQAAAASTSWSRSRRRSSEGTRGTSPTSPRSWRSCSPSAPERRTSTSR